MNKWTSPIRSFVLDSATSGSQILIAVDITWNKTLHDVTNSFSYSSSSSSSSSSYSYVTTSSLPTISTLSQLSSQTPPLHLLSDDLSMITVHVISESGAYYTGTIDPPVIKVGSYGALKSSSTRSRLSIAASTLAFNNESDYSVRFHPEDISGQRRLQVLNAEIVVATGSLRRSIISDIETNLSKLLWVCESTCALTTLLKNEAEDRARRAETLLAKLQSENAQLIEGRENADADILEGCSKLLNSKKAEIFRLKEDVKELTIALAESKRECKEEREAKELSLARQLILETEMSATDDGDEADDGTIQDVTTGEIQESIRPFAQSATDSEDEERMMNGLNRRRGDGRDEDIVKPDEELDGKHYSADSIKVYNEKLQVPSRKRPAPSLD